MSDILYKIDVTQALAALDQIGAADAKLRAAAEQTGQAQKQTFTEAAQAAVAYQQKLAAAGSEVSRAGEVYRELRAVLSGVAREGQEMEKSLKASGGAATEAGQRIKADLTANKAKQAELRVEIDLTRKAIDEERAAVARVRQEQQQQVGQQKLVTAAVRDTAVAQKQAASAAKEAASSNAGGGSEGFFGGLLGKLGPIAAGLFTVSKLVGAIRQGIDDYANISGIQATFKTLTGSAQAGAQEFAFIRGEANRFGLELAPIARSYASLYAAAKEANLPLEQTRAIFQGVTAAGKTFNLSSAETEQALKAVQQMLSKGTVQSQELKLQLGNVLPGAFALAAKAANLTTVEFGKQLEQGKILASDFLPKFAKQLQITYGAGTEDAANSVRSNMGRINTFFQEQSAKIGALVAPLVGAFASIVAAEETAAQKSDRLVSAYQKQTGALKDLKDTVGPLVARYDELSNLTGRNAAQQKELDDVMQQLAKSVPGAVTEFDAYGKALGINSKAVRQFIQDQEDLVKYNNRGRLKENSTALRELVDERNRLQKQLNNTETDPGSGLKLRREEYKVGQGQAVPSLLSAAESAAITNKLAAQLEEVQTNIKANLNNRQILRGKSLLVPNLDDDAEAKGLQGLIEKQKKVIEDIQKRQTAALEENAGKGKDYLQGKGGLNRQLEAAQKELDRLLGKVDKEAKKPKGPDYLKQLLAEEERLRKEAAKGELGLLKDQGEARAAEQYRQALAEVKATEEKLRKLERLAGRDGKIDGVQAAALASLRAAASDAYLAELQRIALAYSDKLFALREESDQKELLAIERKYDREAQAARGQTALLLAIEEARQRELQAVRQRQQQQQIEERGAESAGAARRIGDIYGAGTGRSVIEAKRDEKRQLLEIDKQIAQESLQNTLLLNTKEGAAQREALAQRLREITRALEEVDKEKARHAPEDLLYKLILGEGDGDEPRERLNRAVKDSLGAVSELLAAQQQLTQAKIDERTRNIDDLNTRLSQEIALNKEGSASNIGNLRDEIKAEKEARREAIKEKRQAAREQILIDTLLQSSSVITAAANALGAFPIPFVGPFLGIAAAGAIVTAFVASKVKAYQAAGKAEFFRGGYTGDGHERQESRQLGEKSYTYHHKEFVHDHDVTARYRHALLEPLHQRNPRLIDWNAPGMRELLPDFTLPARIQAERQAAAHLHVTHQFAPMQSQFDAMQRELSAIRQHTDATASRSDVVPMQDGYMVIDPVTRSTHTVRTRKVGG